MSTVNTTNMTTISFRTEEKKRDELDVIAANMDRDRSWVINEALEQYLELKRWQAEHIAQGIRDSNEGRTYSTEEVLAKIEQLHLERTQAE